eukprot:6053109-Prymnesium_polylepis.1
MKGTSVPLDSRSAGSVVLTKRPPTQWPPPTTVFAIFSTPSRQPLTNSHTHHTAHAARRSSMSSKIPSQSSQKTNCEIDVPFPPQGNTPLVCRRIATTTVSRISFARSGLRTQPISAPCRCQSPHTCRERSRTHPSSPRTSQRPAL